MDFKEVMMDDAYLSKPFDLNFICNLLYSEPETFGKFSYDLSKIEIDTNACFKGKRLIDLAVEHRDKLALKFLQLFQPDIEAVNDKKERVLEIAIKNGNLELLKAVLEIPVEEEYFEAYLSQRTLQALGLVSENDSSLLMLAAQLGKQDVVRFLLECGLNVNTLNVAEKTACDFAWDNCHLDCVIELLKADSPFPREYEWDDEPEGSELDQISRQRDDLHKQIRNNESDDVKSFFKENPKLKCAYDNRNQCALVTALESKNYEIYSFLRSKGFTHGIDEDHKKILFVLPNQDKEALKISNRKYFPTNENYIILLLFRSRLGFGSEQARFEKIQKYFETLDAIAECQPIIQVIALARSLNIVFDFNQLSIADMDPTQNFEHIDVKGRTIYNNGYIYIGAKGSDAEVLATMAHEFTHYAMHLLYDNFGSPYHISDDESIKEYSEIVNYCKAKKTENIVIENVFIYAQEEWAPELIARVPHLLALYYEKPNAIAQARMDFGRLFQFFNDRVLSKCEQEIPVMKVKQAIWNSDQFSGVWFNVKHPVELFTGRTKELIDLHEKIQQSKDTLTVVSQMTSISGLGGIGKSELARKYAHDYHHYYDGNVIWINAEKIETLRASFYELAKDNRLSISTIDKDGKEKTVEAIVKEVYNFFTRRRSLFIFDNAEKFRTQRDGDEGIDKFLPSLPSNAIRPYVLITSRNQKWGNVKVIPLGTLSEIEAMGFITKKLKLGDGVQDQDVEKLARTLQYFPLALQQAMAYIKQTDEILKNIGSKFGIADYLKRYIKETENLLDFEFPQDSSVLSTKTTFATWTITIEKIKENKLYGQHAIEVLDMIAFLSPDNIPIEIFLNLKLINGDKEKLGYTIELLKQYSMVNEGKQQNVIDVHRLVQKVTRIKLKKRGTTEKHIKKTFQLLEKSFPHCGNTVEDFAKKRKLLPHLKEFLIHFKDWAASQPENMDTTSYLENLLAWTVDGYSDTGAFTIRKDLLKRALKIKQEHHGLDHFEVANTLNNLGNAYGDLGDHQKKMELLEQALKIRQEHYGPDHFEVAKTLNNIGNAYGDLGDHQKQKESLERAIKIEEKHYGPDHFKVAITLNNLGNAYGDLGVHQKQKELLERALKIKQEHYGPDHFEVASTLNNLGNAYGYLGDPQKQKELLEQALKLRQEHYGPDHFEVAKTLINLVKAYGDYGDHQKQKNLLERAINIVQEVDGPDHFEVAITLNNLGNAYGDLGDLQKQKELLERALKIKQEHYGPDHFEVASTLNNLGNAYGDFEDHQKQKELLERALKIEQEHYGLDHFEVASTLNNLGNAYGDFEDHQKQKDLLERALKIKQEHYGPDRFKVASTLNNLGNAYGDLGDHQKKRSC